MPTVHRLIAVILGVCVGCGGESGGAAGVGRFAGFWQVGSATLPASAVSGAPGAATMTMTRTTTPFCLRADYTFTASDATHGHLAGRLGVLENDLIRNVFPMDAAVTIAGDEWSVASAARTVVYAAALAGERLTLTLDLSDPRNADPGDSPLVLVMERMAPPPAATVGDWTMLEMDIDGLTLHGDTCTRLTNQWITMHIVFEIDARHLMERTATVTGYVDSACATAKGAPSVARAKALLEEGASQVELWLEMDSGSRQHWTFALATPAPGQLELTRTCAPPSACVDEPTRLLLERTD